MREFNSGATRDNDEGKLDFEGFLSHDVLYSFAEYMHQNRQQPDGKVRSSDNWQKGIPENQYMKSLWRHFMDVWKAHRTGDRQLLTESLNALLFNAMGMQYENLKVKNASEHECTRTSSCVLAAKEANTRIQERLHSRG